MPKPRIPHPHHYSESNMVSLYSKLSPATRRTHRASTCARRVHYYICNRFVIEHAYGISTHISRMRNFLAMKLNPFYGWEIYVFPPLNFPFSSFAKYARSNTCNSGIIQGISQFCSHGNFASSAIDAVTFCQASSVTCVAFGKRGVVVFRHLYLMFSKTEWILVLTYL